MIQKLKKIYQIVLATIVAILFVLTLYVLIAGTVALKNKEMIDLFGYTYSIVPTKSMEPEINVGDSVIAKKVDFEELEIGDDIIYHYVKEDVDIFIVHRIIRREDGGFKTQGINNAYEDDGIVTEDNYVAKVVWTGNVANMGELVLNNRDLIFLILTVVLILMIINGVFDILKILEEKRKIDREEEKQKLQDDFRAKLRKEIEEELACESNKLEEANNDQNNQICESAENDDKNE